MPIKDNLEGWWDLEEASGNRIDAHGANDLTDGATTPRAAGKVGFGVELNSSDWVYIDDPASLTFVDEDFTVAFWWWTGDIFHAASRWAVAKCNTDTGFGGREYDIFYKNGINKFVFNVSNGGGQTEAVASAFGTPAEETWYYLVAWHDSVANTINIQVNNETPENSAHTTGCHNGDGWFAIGRLGEAVFGHADGIVDSVGVWRRVLTSDERTELYNSGDGVGYADLAADTPRGSTFFFSLAGMGMTAALAAELYKDGAVAL